MKTAVKKHLHFLSKRVKEKFVSQEAGKSCPFSNRNELTDVIDEDGKILLVKNKFAILKNACQTVLIETDDCFSNIATYDKEHMCKIITFGIDNWLKMEESGNFRSVVFYKNHGPLSGGSIDHAHMQIVGLEDIDYRHNLCDDIFTGIEIYRKDNCIVNLSTAPLSCSTEFNIITDTRNDMFMADNIQKIVRYILKQTESYNIFFYQWSGSIICKISPRYITSPFLIGFSIPQTSDRLEENAGKIKSLYSC